MEQSRNQTLRLPKTKFAPKDISESIGKIPPQALDLEESVVGALLLEAPAVGKVKDFLQADHFYSEQHKIIYQAIIEMHEAGNPTDMRSIGNELKRIGKLEVIGGKVYLAELTSRINSSASIDYHARVIMEKAMAREMIQQASEIHRKAYDTDNVFELIEKSIENIQDILRWREAIDVKSYMAPDVVYLKKLRTKPSEISYTTHIKLLDQYFRWTLGTVAAWFGWPGDGKGTFYDFVAVLNAMRSDWIYIIAKPEDLLSKMDGGEGVMSADMVYANLAHTYLGKPIIQDVAKNLNVSMASDEEIDLAMQWVTDHFRAVEVEDSDIDSLLSAFDYQVRKIRKAGDKRKIVLLIDPWTAYDMEEKGRGDFTLRSALRKCKKYALKNNVRFDIITHPGKMTEVRERTSNGKKDGPYKRVDQYVALGGTSWDNGCDQLFSIHQYERHLQNPNDDKVRFWGLKQKFRELVGSKPGSLDIRFNKLTRRYLFDNTDPISDTKYGKLGDTAPIAYAPVYQASADNPVMPANKDDLPF